MGIKFAAPVEKSGQKIFDFEYGNSFGEKIKEVNADFVKILVRWNPSDDSDTRQVQGERIKTLYQPYSTRHTFITRLVEAKVQAKQVMDLAGHTCIETTMSFYTHSTDDLLEDAISSLETYKEKKRKQKTPAVANSMIGHNSRKVLK